MNQEDNGEKFKKAIEIVAKTYFKAHKRENAEFQDFLFSLSLDDMDKDQLMAVLFLTVHVKVDVL